MNDYDLHTLSHTIILLDECLREIFERFNKTISKLLSILLEKQSDVIKEIIRSLSMLDLQLPNLETIIANYDYVPQAPPNITKTAIQNFRINISKYKNSNLIIMIKTKCPTFIETLVYEILIYFIFKALGM